MGLLDRLRGGGSDEPSRGPVCELSPDALEDARRAFNENYNFGYMNCGKGSAEIYNVIGTGEYQDALRIVAEASRPWRHEWNRNLPSVLRPESDPVLVRVLMDGYTVGYLPEKVARTYRPILDELANSGQSLVCSALVVGGDAGKKYGVRIHIKPGIGTRWAKGSKPSDI